jgi:hypothetical protein
MASRVRREPVVRAGCVTASSGRPVVIVKNSGLPDGDLGPVRTGLFSGDRRRGGSPEGDEQRKSAGPGNVVEGGFVGTYGAHDLWVVHAGVSVLSPGSMVATLVVISITTLVTFTLTAAGSPYTSTVASSATTESPGPRFFAWRAGGHCYLGLRALRELVVYTGWSS